MTWLQPELLKGNGSDTEIIAACKSNIDHHNNSPLLKLVTKNLSCMNLSFDLMLEIISYSKLVIIWLSKVWCFKLLFNSPIKCTLHIVSVVPLLLLFMAAACDLVSIMTPLEAPPKVWFINFSSSRLLLLPIAVNGWPHRNSTTCVLIKITFKRNTFQGPSLTVFKTWKTITDSKCYMSNLINSCKNTTKLQAWMIFMSGWCL